MSNKENILHTALRLFAEQGYDRTPTSQIAREAGVSEGLIFRHYGSKAGLLAAIIRAGVEQVDTTMVAYDREADPRTAIVRHIEDAFLLLRSQTEFWRLVHQMRRQPAVLETAAQQLAEFHRAVSGRMTARFKLLGAAQPELEALLLFALIDGITLQYLQAPEHYPLDEVQQLLTKKYRHESFLDQP